LLSFEFIFYQQHLLDSIYDSDHIIPGQMMHHSSTILTFLAFVSLTNGEENGPGGGGSGRGFGRGPIGDYKCYQVCPPIVYPTGHDPY